MFEMHLFDEDARQEQSFCGAKTSAEGRMGVYCYLEDRLNDTGVGTVCEGCKALSVPFAETHVMDLEADGDADEAEELRRLAGTLARETGQGRTYALSRRGIQPSARDAGGPLAVSDGIPAR